MGCSIFSVLYADFEFYVFVAIFSLCRRKFVLLKAYSKEIKASGDGFCQFTRSAINVMNKQLSNFFFQRSGLPKELAWGYLGVIIFMMGDGVEQGWLSPYMIEHGMSMGQSASLFTVYGWAYAGSTCLCS